MRLCPRAKRHKLTITCEWVRVVYVPVNGSLFVLYYKSLYSSSSVSIYSQKAVQSSVINKYIYFLLYFSIRYFQKPKRRVIEIHPMLRGPKVVAPKRLSMGEEEDESSDSEWEELLAACKSAKRGKMTLLCRRSKKRPPKFVGCILSG